MEDQHSEWLGVKHGFFENHFADAEPFIHCYMLFSGVAGKCANCYAEPLCLDITKEFKKYARNAIELASAGYKHLEVEK